MVAVLVLLGWNLSAAGQENPPLMPAAIAPPPVELAPAGPYPVPPALDPADSYYPPRFDLPEENAFTFPRLEATGPGANYQDRWPMLNGALAPESGWPQVLLDHFAPRPERTCNLWLVQTRDCPQAMGSDPWPALKVWQLDPCGGLVRRDPQALLAQCAGRPVLIQVQGYLTTPDIALGGLLWTHTWLERYGVLPCDAVLIAFDWPSARTHKLLLRDINQKGRLAFVAAWHLACFVQALPPCSRVCLLGQSYGGRVVPAALHLLGGGALDEMDGDSPVRLPQWRPDLRLRAVSIAGAIGHHWLNPGEKLEFALPACEAFLNLYNSHDRALIWYPLLIPSEHHRALGRVGLLPKDVQRLGSLMARYAEFDMHPVLGREHTLLNVVANPQLAPLLALYLFADEPSAAPPLPPPAGGWVPPAPVVIETPESEPVPLP